MPDIPNRTDEESELAAVLLLLFTRWRQEAFAALDDPPRAANLSESFYASHAADVERELAEKLYDIHFQASLRMAIATGATERVDDLRRLARQWAEERAATLAKELADRIRAAVEEAISRYDEAVAAARDRHPDNQAARSDALDAAAAILVRSLGEIFSEHRADSIAITEITGAASAGEIAEARRIGENYRVPVEAIWRAENDDRVCPVCDELDGKGKDEFGEDFPEGPPAHVNCRCYLEWSVDGEPVLN